MGKLDFLFRTFKSFSIKTLFNLSKKISKDKKKNRFFIIIDMIGCAIKYGAAFYDYQEFEFYNLNKKQRKTYLTRGINNKIVKTYNDKNYWYIFNDKFTFNKMFSKYLNRDIINLNESTLEDFTEFVQNKDFIIAKPNCGEGGKGIELIKVTKDIKKIYNNLKNNNICLVEEVISQHKDLSKLYDKSVNSLRMFTFYDGEKPHFLQAVLKLGNGGFVDNFSSGGMYCFVNNEGVVFTPAIDQDDNIYTTHPITKSNILDFKVPHFKEAVDLVKEASSVVKKVKYVGWDVAITDKGPVLIEGNCYPGIFQIKPSISDNKTGLVPIYEKIMKLK